MRTNTFGLLFVVVVVVVVVFLVRRRIFNQKDRNTKQNIEWVQRGRKSSQFSAVVSSGMTAAFQKARHDWL